MQEDGDDLFKDQSWQVVRYFSLYHTTLPNTSCVISQVALEAGKYTTVFIP